MPAGRHANRCHAWGRCDGCGPRLARRRHFGGDPQRLPHLRSSRLSGPIAQFGIPGGLRTAIRQARGAFAARQTDDTVQFSNQKPDGTLIQPDEERYRILKGNEGWHTDSTYMPFAAKASMLMALVMPPEGGGTEFADLRATYHALDQDTQHRLNGLSAYHSLNCSRKKAGYPHTTDNLCDFHDKGAPLRSIIKTHSETGRKSIYTGRHAYGIPGLSAAESESLLDGLMADACQPPRTYLHRWTVGDLVVWDNHRLMHCARPYNTDYPRVLRASHISGEPETELAPTFAVPGLQRSSRHLAWEQNISGSVSDRRRWLHGRRGGPPQAAPMALAVWQLQLVFG